MNATRTTSAPVRPALPAPDTEAVRARDRRHVWHTWTPLAADRSALTLSHGSGHHVWDIDGRAYLDASALNSTCGYAHPHVLRALAEQASRLHHFDLSVAGHEPAGLLAERLAGHLPPGMDKTLFVNSGSEGFDAAVMMAVSYWAHLGRPRSRLVTFARSYHGATLLSRSLSTLPRSTHLLDPPVPVTRVELPLEPALLRHEEALPVLLAAFERAIGDDPDDLPAAVVVEPFLNVGGAVVLPPGFLRELRALCDATGTLLVLDEVFTAYGRCGAMFAARREGVTPDVLVSSKGLSGGYVPIAAVTVGQHVHDTFGRDPVIGGLRYGHTTSGHAVACAAALATLDVLEEGDLPGRAERLGTGLLGELAPLTGARGVVDVRGLGLILVVETASPELAARVLTRARERGLLLRQVGAAVMAVPPLVIDDEGAAALAAGLTEAVTDVAG
ncbi:aminotransferase class III-fold pyridoxal phosphate-dependent enzyme [Streptomyces sp. NBC_01478]|uniref:aminotransferase family protein n=1 Tax=Streptomyces sp. NBC_01478 TaxID=2903882 RepID=UPI002E2FAC16|nr:aminotransferase class III-fold pyridoxal phosphate-dependent enzyme [Streptomyces sp. NBC_01478]